MHPDPLSLNELRERLFAGRMPRLRRLQWPRFKVAKYFLDQLYQNPGVLQWCRHSQENVDKLVDGLEAIENCLGKRQSELAANQTEAHTAQESEVLPFGQSEVETPGWWSSARRTFLRWKYAKQDDELLEHLAACFSKGLGDVISLVLGLSKIVAALDMLGLSGCGWDLSPNSFSGNDLQRILELERKLQESESLTQICEQLGRMESVLSEQESSPLSQIYDELFELRRVRQRCQSPGVPHSVRGIEYSNDLENMIASELTLLSDADLEPLWYAKFAGGQLETYKTVGNEFRRKVKPVVSGKSKLGRGPFIALVDCSGSMSGTPLAISKAVTLGMCKLAFRQHRDVYLIKFSSAPVSRHILSFDAGGVEKLFEFLLDSYGGGGTDIDTPLKDVARLMESDLRWERSDLVIMSDGDFHVGADAKLRIDKVKEKKGLRVTGIVTGSNRGPFESLCSPGKLHPVGKWEVF